MVAVPDLELEDMGAAAISLQPVTVSPVQQSAVIDGIHPGLHKPSLERDRLDKIWVARIVLHTVKLSIGNNPGHVANSFGDNELPVMSGQAITGEAHHIRQ